MKQALALAGLAAFLGGCASGAEAPVPVWVAEGAASAGSGYPDLRSVPTAHQANTDQAHWDAVEAETVAAGAALRANPRAEFGAPPEDPNAFLEQAQDDLEETRDSH